MSRAKEITAANGGRWCGSYGVMPTPGHSKKDNGTRIWDGRDGRVLIHCHNGDWRDVRDALGLGQDEAEELTKEERRKRWEEAERERRERELKQLATAANLWSASARICEGSPVWAYLLRRRIPESLLRDIQPTGYVRDYDDGSGIPRMIVQGKNAAGQSRCVQITKLNPGGLGRAKTYKLTHGPMAGGVAVRLTPAQGDTLAVAEGVETALSYTALSGHPCWATLGTASLEAFKPPVGVKTIIIAADNDEAGQASARNLRDALSIWHRVIIHTPEQGDWNDALRELEGAS
jgi:phage/plasmid primase-like uncharacterized protein